MEGKEVKKIEIEAKQLMDNFFTSLNKIKVDETKIIINNKESLRDAIGIPGDSDFRDALFKIANKKNRDFFMAEKGKWI